MLSWFLIFLSLSISSVFDSPTTANYKLLCVYAVYRKSLGGLYSLCLLSWITTIVKFFLHSVPPKPVWVGIVFWKGLSSAIYICWILEWYSFIEGKRGGRLWKLSDLAEESQRRWKLPHSVWFWVWFCLTHLCPYLH